MQDYSGEEDRTISLFQYFGLQWWICSGKESAVNIIFAVLIAYIILFNSIIVGIDSWGQGHGSWTG